MDVILNIFWMFYRTCGSSSWLLLKMKVTDCEMAVVWTYKLYIAGPLSCVLCQHTIHIVGEKVISLLVDLWLPSVTYSSSVAWNSEVLQIFTVVSGINSRLLFVSHALISLVPDRGPLNGCVCVCDSPSSLSGTSSISSIDSPLSSSITLSLFQSRLKTFLFCKSFRL